MTPASRTSLAALAALAVLATSCTKTKRVRRYVPRYHLPAQAKCIEPGPLKAFLCPEACTGGCDDGICFIRCDGEGECAGQELACPDELDCELHCDGPLSCADSTLVCPDRRICFASCQGNAACRRLVVEGGRVDTTLDCSPKAFRTCQGAKVNCGSGPCQAACLDEFAPVLNCGRSCSCQPCR